MGESIDINMNKRDYLVEDVGDQTGRERVTSGGVEQPSRSSDYYLMCCSNIGDYMLHGSR